MVSNTISLAPGTPLVVRHKYFDIGEFAWERVKCSCWARK